MKRFISFLLLLVLLMCIWGCDSADDVKSANFYYVRNTYIYGAQDGVMAAEVRSIEGLTREQDVLREYLRGPQDISLSSPFPADTEITDFYFKDEILYITLCTHMVTLPKAEQVLACACLARTAMELTGVQSVHFQTDEADFARMDPILFDRDSVLLYDDYSSASASEP